MPNYDRNTTNVADGLSTGPDEMQVKKNSEAFLNLAAGMPQPQPEAQPQPQPQPQLQPEPQPQTLSPIDKSRMGQSIGIGPSYLDALSKLESVDDTKAIEVQLPISKKVVQISSITGAEEQAIKTASVSPDSFLKKLNELVYYHTEFQDGSRPSFVDFLSGLYPPDKSTLIWGLLSASYVVLPDVERTCSSCGGDYILKSSPGDLIHEDTFAKGWDQALPPEEFILKQSAYNGYITFEFGLPSEKDRILITSMVHPQEAKDNVTQNGDILSHLDVLTFFTKSISVGDPGQETILTDLTQDIYPFLKNLSPKVADAVRSEIDLSMFNDYMPVFYVNATCDKCGAEERVEEDPELLYFRKCLSI